MNTVIPAEAVARAAAVAALPHICVCICTYKRPALLQTLLKGLSEQETDNLFTYSALIVDNDGAESAKSIAAAFCNILPVRYVVQPQQSIPLTRNQAVSSSTGDYIAFIDDDEFPTPRWLVTLFAASRRYNVDGVLGPVKPHFVRRPP